MATNSNSRIAQAIYLVLKDKPFAEQQILFRKIAQFLYRKRLLSQSSEILSQLRKITNKEEGRTAVKVYTAKKMEERTKVSLLESLKKRYSAKEIVFEEILNEKLLGGIKLEVDDEVIDLTLKNKIKKLQEYLTKPA